MEAERGETTGGEERGASERKVRSTDVPSAARLVWISVSVWISRRTGAVDGFSALQSIRSSLLLLRNSCLSTGVWSVVGKEGAGVNVGEGPVFAEGTAEANVDVVVLLDEEEKDEDDEDEEVRCTEESGEEEEERLTGREAVLSRLVMDWMKREACCLVAESVCSSTLAIAASCSLSLIFVPSPIATGVVCWVI